MEEFFKQGLAHPLLTTSHMMLSISLGLLLGQQGRSFIFRCIVVFTVTLIASAFLTRVLPLDWNTPFISLVVAAVLGLLIAAKLKLTIWLVMVLAVVVGFLLGQESAPIMIPGIKAMTIYSFFIGASITATGVLVVVSLIALLLRNIGSGIVLRVLGSWVVASAVMVQILLIAKPS